MAHLIALLIAGMAVIHLTLTQTIGSQSLQLHQDQDEDGFLLGEVAPTAPGGGSVDQSSAPVFLEQPRSAFVMRNKPATLTCRAAHVLHLYFRCNGHLVPDQEHSLTDLVDPQTAVRQLEKQLDVTRNLVQQYFGDYSCVCVAWSSSGEKTSPSAQVTVSYLKKSFETPPFSEAVEAGKTAELRCVPPEGSPTPVISWLKNGVPIDPKLNPNYIISSESNLLIVAAKLTDLANYSCVAENVASRRVSEPALLTVFVNGGWSDWGVWSACNPSCGVGVMVRHRQCSRPQPVNGGLACIGSSIQKRDCSTSCPPVDGGWSQFSVWSHCDVTCRQFRSRSCSSPSPAHGGQSCAGPDTVSRNCSLSDCSGLPPGLEKTRTDQAVRALARSDIALYIGLTVTLLLIPVAGLIAFKIYRSRKGRGQSLYGLTDRDYEARYYNSKKQLSYTPDLTSDVTILTNSTPPSRSNDYNYTDPNNKKAAALMSTSPCEHHYDEPHLALMKHMDSTQYSGGESDAAPAVATMSSAITNNSSSFRPQHHQSSHSSSSYTGSSLSRPGSLCGEGDDGNSSCRQSLLSNTLPPSVDPETLQLCTVTSTGATLSLPESGVSLMIPEGAVAVGHSEDVYLAVTNDSNDRPLLAEHETLLSPVVLAGPPGTQFLKPVIVSFHHCAGLKSPWGVSVFGAESQPDEAVHWQRIVKLGEETINTPIYTQLDNSKVYIMADFLQRFAIVGEPVGSNPSVKNVKLAAFGPRLVAGSAEYCIRVYVIEDTRVALESVLRLERKLGGRPLDKPKSMTFQSGGANLCLSLEDLSLGWRCKPQGNNQEIPYSHVWGGTCPLLHCSFSLEHVGHATRDGLSFSARVQVHQKGCQSRRQMLRISSAETNQVSSPMPSQRSMIASSVTLSGTASPTVVPLNGNTYRLSTATKHALGKCLNPPNSRGNDWRMLAQMMQVHRYITYFATKKSPTDHILDLWESRHSGLQACTELLNILRIMGREDAARIVEEQVGPQV